MEVQQQVGDCPTAEGFGRSSMPRIKVSTCSSIVKRLQVSRSAPDRQRTMSLNGIGNPGFDRNGAVNSTIARLPSELSG
jgi:hypothetical protein